MFRQFLRAICFTVVLSPMAATFAQSNLERKSKELIERGDYIGVHDLLATSDSMPHVTKSVSLCRRLAIASARIGEHDTASGCFGMATSFWPNDVEVLNDAAWYFATAGERRHRNGKRAIELARKAECVNDIETTFSTDQ